MHDQDMVELEDKKEKKKKKRKEKRKKTDEVTVVRAWNISPSCLFLHPSLGTALINLQLNNVYML
jgi:hypothetical protein